VRLRKQPLYSPYCPRVRSDVPCNDDEFFFNAEAVDIGSIVEKKEIEHIGSLKLVKQEAHSRKYLGHIGPIVPCGFRSMEPPITLLTVCRESYDVVASRYSRSFGTRFARPEIWVDFSRDTVFLDFGERSASSYYYSVQDIGENIRRIRHLSLWYLPPYKSHKKWDCDRNRQFALSQLANILKYTNGLQTLSFAQPQMLKENFRGGVLLADYQDLKFQLGHLRQHSAQYDRAVEKGRRALEKQFCKLTEDRVFSTSADYEREKTYELFPPHYEFSADDFNELRDNYPIPRHMIIAPGPIVKEVHRLDQELESRKEAHITTIRVKNPGRYVFMDVSENNLLRDIITVHFFAHNLREEPAALLDSEGDIYCLESTVYNADLQPGQELRIILCNSPEGRRWMKEIKEQGDNWSSYFTDPRGEVRETSLDE